MPSQSEINVTTQSGGTLYVKVDLLNNTFQKVDELVGVIIGEPSINNDATSDIRRTLSMSITPTDSSFDIKYGGKIWLDKYVKVYVGLTDIYTDEIIYTTMGVYIINNPNQVYNADTNTISLSCIDLMGLLNGERGGTITDVSGITIPMGSNIRQAIIGRLVANGFDSYIVQECPVDTLSEITFGQGTTEYEILSTLRDVYPNYQIYFDVDGVFHYEPIPNGTNSQVMIDDTIFSKVIVDYSIQTDYTKVKNYIEVWGRTHDIYNYGVGTLSGSTTFLCTIPTVNSYYWQDGTGWMDGVLIGFTALTPPTVMQPKININGMGSKDIRTETGEWATLENTNNVYYVIKYNIYKGYFVLYGNITAHAISYDNNPQSPFYLNGTMPKNAIVIEDTNIYTSTQAKERADYELYRQCKLYDSITLNCSPIFWADTNWVVELTPPSTTEKRKYLIKNISTTLGVGATQSINLMRIYE